VAGLHRLLFVELKSGLHADISEIGQAGQPYARLATGASIVSGEAYDAIDADMVDRIEVALAFDDPSGWEARDTFIVRAGDAPKSWKIRHRRPMPANSTTR